MRGQDGVLQLVQYHREICILFDTEIITAISTRVAKRTFENRFEDVYPYGSYTEPTLPFNTCSKSAALNVKLGNATAHRFF